MPAQYDAVVNSPAEAELQKMKEASESLVRKIHEFRAEFDPDWKAPEETQPDYAPEPDDNTQEGAGSGIDSREPVIEPLAEKAGETTRDSLHAPIREAQEFDPPNDDLRSTRAENWDSRKHDGRVPPAAEPRETPQEASESLIRKIREFREEVEAEDRAKASSKNARPTGSKRE